MKKILNHFKKNWYKYALETFVVIVGILIAMGLNNWNERKKNRQSEIKILSELKNDLKFNYNEISIINDRTIKLIDGTDSLIEILEDKTFDFNKDLKLFESLGNEHVGVFNNSNTTYSYIENKGFEALTNDSLRLSISYMYQRRFLNISFRENRYLNFVHNILTPYILSNFHLQKGKASVPIDPIKLITDPKFKNLLVRLSFMLEISTVNLSHCLDELELLIQDVENEINSLRN